jgi:hypothetical protein
LWTIITVTLLKIKVTWCYLIKIDIFLPCCNTTTLKLKQSPYRPGMAQRVPGS